MNYDTTVERMIRSSDAALKVQTAKAQQLERALKDAEARFAETQRQLATVEQQLARMYGDLDDKDRELAAALAAATKATDLLEQAQAQREATSAQLNAALAVVNAAQMSSAETRKQMLRDMDSGNYIVIAEYLNCIDFALEQYAAQQAQAEEAQP